MEDVKCRVKGVVEKLKDCFGELHGIMTNGSSQERSELVSTVREVLGALETGLKRAPEEQEDSARSKRMRSDPGTCTHTCVHHPETVNHAEIVNPGLWSRLEEVLYQPGIVNPGVWSKLTEDLVALVFARLPIPRILELRKSSEVWSAMSESASFISTFVSANSKLFGLLGWANEGVDFCMWIPDAAIKEWHEIKLDFPKGIAYSDSYPIGSGYYDSMYACDGGLLCVVPEWDLEYCDCVVVCNPLTDEWRKLPCLWTSYRYRAPVLVQLVTDELFYRVTLVCSEKNLQDVQIYGAFVYDSRTESWSVKNSGLVLGTGSSLWQSKHEPLVFDCAGKVLFELDLNNFAALRDLKRPRCSIVDDRLFVLHALINPRRWVISEFMWESSGLDFRKLKEYEVGLEGIEDVRISITTGFILSACGMETENGSMRELIRMYDVSTGQWHDLPPLIGGPATPIQELFDNFFVCELRWDAEP